MPITISLDFEKDLLITIAPIKEIDEAIEFIKSKIDPDNYFQRVLEIFCQNMDWMLWGKTMEY
ncbi:hypothetical protein HZS_3135 [Henneguya salminicola]|nr:hypothetical protein HZS_3135 [Henneguya salminicola]